MKSNLRLLGFDRDKRPASVIKQNTKEIQTIREYIEENRKLREERRKESIERTEEYHRKVDKILDDQGDFGS